MDFKASGSPARSVAKVLWALCSALPVQLSGEVKAKERIFFPLQNLAAVPATFRNSTDEKVFALPPPTKSTRLALVPAGWCSKTVSKSLPVISLEAINTSAAFRIAESED